MASIPTVPPALCSSLTARTLPIRGGASSLAQEETMDQQLRLGRIVLEDVQAAHQQVTIDLVFVGNAVKRGMEAFGVWRDLQAGGICPFLMNDSGEVDFGTTY